MKVFLKNVSLKDVHDQDLDFILELRNQFYSMFYFQYAPIIKEDHYEYMKKQKLNSKFYHWIICVDHDQIGYVRILDGDVGIMIKKEFQKHGIASYALKLVENKAKSLGIEKLIALIMTENTDSIHLFAKNNYHLKMNMYEKYLK